MDGHTEQESLKEQMTRINEEARMVLPGIQALFGFQTIAVCSDRFKDLPDFAQGCHATALALVVVAIALVMLPAAYHRLAESGRVSRRAIRIASRAICCALAPLAAGLALDIGVVLFLVTGQASSSAAAGVAVFAFLLGAWFAFPFLLRQRRER